MDFLVGTYSRNMAGVIGKGEGLYAVSFDPDTGFGAPSLAMRCANPSALAMDRENRIVFCTRELFTEDGPGLASFRLQPDGSLTSLSDLPLEGELPCQIVYDPHNHRLASAQYWTGDAVVCGAAGGELSLLSSFERHGSGPNASRQEGPHAHCVGFTDMGTVLHLADLGTDCIVSHRLTPEGQLAETQSLSLPAGCGPRHFVINADETRAYVVSELSEELFVLDRDGFGWTCREVVQGFPVPGGVEGSCAAIRLSPDERQVYISGRRQSRIAAFSVTDAVVLIAEHDCGGETPRDFILTRDGNWAISANQDAGNLAALRRDTATGRLGAVAYRCDIPSAVAVLEL